MDRIARHASIFERLYPRPRPKHASCADAEGAGRAQHTSNRIFGLSTNRKFGFLKVHFGRTSGQGFWQRHLTLHQEVKAVPASVAASGASGDRGIAGLALTLALGDEAALPGLPPLSNLAGKRVNLLYGSQEDDHVRGRGAFAFGEDTGREEGRQDLRGLRGRSHILPRYYLEETGGPEASREERPGNGTYEEHPPRPRVPLLSGGRHPTLGERFEEELHRS
jgi:hypothetical protein